MNTKTLKEINQFINQLDQKHFNDDYSNCLNDFLTNDFLEELEQNDPEKCFNDIYEELEENGFFNIEVIYYSEAIKYLFENDPSFKESIETALEYGCNLESVNSELLASLLASKKARDEFNDLRYDFINFFQK